MKNKVLIIKQWVVGFAIILCLAIGGFSCYKFGQKKLIKKIGEVAFIKECSIKIEDNWENPYPMIDSEVSYYIIKWCKSLEIDEKLAISILLKENSELNKEAVSRPNKNGTFDIGLWQLNDKCLYNNFLPSYWKFDEKWNENPIEFNPMDWQHNTYIALHLIADLTNTFHDAEAVAAAYNCGTGATLRGEIPTSTVAYVRTVMNYYNLL